DIWIRDLERGVNTRATFEEGMVAVMGWSPDGREIAVGEYMPAEEIPSRTRFIFADGSGESRPAYDGMILTFDGQWTAGVVNVDVTSRKPELFSIDLETLKKQPTSLQHGTGLRGMALNPAGTLLAYTSDESGEAQV